jgi:hypothetical protein
LREALARSNLDMIMAEEARTPSRAKPTRTAAAPKAAAPKVASPKTAASPKRAAPKKAAWSVRGFWRRRLPQRPFRAAAITAFVGLLCAIAVNAALLQKGRHPAPLFGSSRPHPRRPIQRSLEPAALRPAPRPSFPAAATARSSRQSSEPSARPQAPVARVDRLGDLISQETVDVGAAERLFWAQKALRRLGFSVKATGAMDGSTRNALLRFERSSKLPSSDDMTSRVVRALADRSGLRAP